MQTEKLKYYPDGQTGLREILASHWLGIDSPRILEAGCGSGSNISIPANAHVVGIDISSEELDKNAVVHEKIVGDLETYPLPENDFDLVVCFDVLEHLRRPQLAMASMASSVKPNGLLLLAFPNVHSLKAVVAKYTPLWFHCAINRFIYGKKAGDPGYINFPTVLDASISPYGMSGFAEVHGFDVQIAALRQSGVQKRFFRKILVGQPGAVVADRIVRMVSFGRLSVSESDCVFLLKKRVNQATS
jgi:SAM-dependent methyltransferase